MALDSSSLLYIQQILDFLNSVVIKFQPFEKVFNSFVPYGYISGYDPYDPTTFPYYRILGGDSAYATVPLYGYSPDTQSEILLTKENVIANPDLVAFYQDLDNLKVLLARYPNDQFIIRRLLNPVVDIQGAIKAKNLTILQTQYEDQILDQYEQGSLINFMQQMLYTIDYRWYISPFEFEDLYPHAFWSMLWSVLPLLLLTKRILNIKTIDVHPFHIWEYLTSMGFGSYKGYLSHSQELFLYRNATYLKWNAGKEFLLDILAKEFLTPIGYSLSQKTVVSSTAGRQITHDKYPTIVPEAGTIEEYLSSSSFSSFLTDIYNAGYDDRDDQLYIDQVTDKFIKAPTNTLSTKFLELDRNIDMSELAILTKFIVDSIMYLNSQNRLLFSVDVTSPVTQNILHFNNPIDALNLMYYCIYANQSPPLSTSTFGKYTITTAITHTSAPTNIPKYVMVNGWNYFVKSYVDLDKTVKNVPYISRDIFTTKALSTKLGDQYKWLFDMINDVENISETVENELNVAVLEVVVPKSTTINVHQTYATFEEYFAEYPNVMAELMEVVSPQQYDSMIFAIITAICPLQYGFAKLQSDDEVISVIIGKIKELFTYMVSYNITFITKTFDDNIVTELPKLALSLDTGIGGDGYTQIINSLIVFNDLDNNGDKRSGSGTGSYPNGINTSGNNPSSIAGRDSNPSNTTDYRLYVTGVSTDEIDSCNDGLDVSCIPESGYTVIDVPTTPDNDGVLLQSGSNVIYITNGGIDVSFEITSN